MCKNEEEILRVVLEWKPMEKTSRGRPKKRQMDKMEYLKEIGSTTIDVIQEK